MEARGVQHTLTIRRTRERLAAALLSGLAMFAGCTQPQQVPAPQVAQYPPLRPAPRHTPTRYTPPKPTTPPAQPFEQSVTIGRSVQDEPMEMTVFGQTGDTTLVLGAFHGNEPTSADVARALIRLLRAEPRHYLGRRVAVIPVVNPDGLARGTRENAHGVDINRNFAAGNFPEDPPPGFSGGPFAGSERETLAVLTAVRQLQPARIISIHSIRRGEHGNNYDGPARALAVEMSRHNGYPVLPTMGYPTPGSFGVWAGVDRQIPTITLELPRDASAETCWRENRDALLAAIRFPVGREPEHWTGPTRPGGVGVGK
ncbi:MAG TPA: M14 family zinc carboxypeptidase [Phycisphaerae bacterium]|nr:M14 family zinc carboxypeptidase [Phycisphaerae bacterium]